ncbi:MAG: hypothetical protein RR053_07605, partial [Evtepia sp.]
MQSNRTFYAKTMLAILLIGCLYIQSALAVTAPLYPERTVRVGFYPMSGFHQYDEQGHPTGYDVDLLNEISSYRNWNYEFVRT